MFIKNMANNRLHHSNAQKQNVTTNISSSDNSVKLNGNDFNGDAEQF